jgi:hypothetical protein
MNKAIALFLISVQIISLASSKATPKAGDLENHYGTDLSQNKFGPNAPQGVNLRREGVAPGVPVSPILNYHVEIKNNEVRSGDLDNTAFDASRIVNAHIAAPKIEIKAKIHHEALVKTPVHLGNQTEEKVVTSFNRVNGQVHSKKVAVIKPIIGIKNEVRNVVHDHTSVVDLSTGKLAKAHPDVKLHGN